MRTLAGAVVVLSSLLGWQLQAGAQQAPTTTAPAIRGSGVAHVGDKGLTPPKPVKEVKPQYTPEAMKAKIQGEVTLECVVKADGTVDDVRVVKSLDAIHGLDEEAVKVAKQWRFKPGLKKGKPVPVAVTLEFAFTLKG